MRLIKQLTAGLLATVALTVAHAAPVRYDFTVSGNWFDTGNPFGMANSPTLNGYLTVDSSLVGIAGLLDFSLTTGSKTWTEDEFVGGHAAQLNYDPSGNLIEFSLHSFSDGGFGTMYIYSNNTMSVWDGMGLGNACNGCVSFGPGTPLDPNLTPEPAGLALLGLTVLAAWAARRKSR